MFYVSGSDGNIYIEPTNGRVTGSLYKTKYIVRSGSDWMEDDDIVCNVPGILYDQVNQAYFPDCGHSEASLIDGTSSFTTGSMIGCVWVYEMNEASKSLIENDADYIATIVESSL